MSAAVKDPEHKPVPVDVQETHRSGEHVIGLDAMIRRSFESAFETDLQATSRVSRFELEEVLSSPEARPSSPPEGPEAPDATVKTTVADVRAAMAAMAEAAAPESEPIVPMPIVNVVPEGIAIESLPEPAIEIDRTKEEERDP